MAEEKFQHTLQCHYGKLRWRRDMQAGWLLFPVTTRANTQNWHRPVPWRLPISTKSDPLQDWKREEICRIFASNNLRITIEVNKKTVNFLDVMLHLTTERFKPYSKPATTPLYVHSKLNNPPNTIGNIPEAINKRLSEISSDKDAFNEAAPLYQKALWKSRYVYNLRFNLAPQRVPNQDRRWRNIIWFNPPFNRNVQTNFGGAFINLIDKCFPTGHKLRKVFNRNTVKLSYSFTLSMKQVIDGHSKATLRKAKQPKQDQTVETCNCRNKNDCSLEGKCFQKEIENQATLTISEKKETCGSHSHRIQNTMV